MNPPRWPLFILETNDGKIWLSQEDFENDKIRELIFEIAFKLLDLAKTRLQNSGGTE